MIITDRHEITPRYPPMVIEFYISKGYLMSRTVFPKSFGEYSKIIKNNYDLSLTLNIKL